MPLGDSQISNKFTTKTVAYARLTSAKKERGWDPSQACRKLLPQECDLQFP